MPELGEANSSAQKIASNAIAQRGNPSEPFQKCADWQELV